MLTVLDPGFFTTVQDLGRRGYGQYGVPSGGAMDPLALRAANRLVGNSPGEAALEITLGGPRLYTRERCLLAVTGAHFDLTVDENPVPVDTALFVRAASVVEFGMRVSGARAYLAVAGGIDVPPVMGSRSTDVRGRFGGLEGRRLAPGDLVTTRSRVANGRAGRMLPDAFRAYYASAAPIRVVWGPHAEYFSDEARYTFFHSQWTVGEQSDRMGIRLGGEALPREEGELLSSGMTVGAIQVPADGRPIILMADHQPTGGYPVIATVIRADIPRLSQKVAGEQITFQRVGVQAAREAWFEIERMLRAV